MLPLTLLLAGVASALPQAGLIGANSLAPRQRYRPSEPFYEIYVPSAEMPRLVLYQQTYHVDGRYVSMKPLVQHNTGVTHVVLSAIHLNEGSNVTLNDHHPSDPRYDQLWEEAAWLKSQGVIVMGMLGGAAPGSYRRLSHEFDYYYSNLLNIIRTHGLEGIDLDVEEPTHHRVIEQLIRSLRRDLGSSFVISLAPVYAAMLPRRHAFVALHHRLLNATTLPPADPVTSALCAAKSVRSTRNLSGFSYVDLEAEVGSMIDFYSVQMYNGWGDASAPHAYRALIEAGWPADKMVMGVLTCARNGHGHHGLHTLLPIVRELRAEYGAAFGGVMGWEYFNADAHRHADRPWEWVGEIGRALGRV